MRRALVCVAALALVAACTKPAGDAGKAGAPAGPTASTPAIAAAPAAPAPPATGPAIAGTYTGNGKAAALTQVTAHTGEPFDDKPVTELVFTTKDQAGDAKASDHALFGNYGDAIIVKVQPDGTVIGTEVIHSALKMGSVSISGPITIKDYKVAGGEISGHLTSGGPVDVFDQKVEIDLTFHTKAP